MYWWDKQDESIRLMFPRVYISKYYPCKFFPWLKVCYLIWSMLHIMSLFLGVFNMLSLINILRVGHFTENLQRKYYNVIKPIASQTYLFKDWPSFSYCTSYQQSVESTLYVMQPNELEWEAQCLFVLLNYTTCPISFPVAYKIFLPSSILCLYVLNKKGNYTKGSVSVDFRKLWNNTFLQWEKTKGRKFEKWVGVRVHT